MMIFDTLRLIVRPYTFHDQENFFQLNGDEEVVKYIRPAKTKEECATYLQEVLTAYNEFPGFGRWAVDEKATSGFIGSFAIIPVENEPGKIQLGYALLKEHWGKGFATELTNRGLKYAFETLKLPEIYGRTGKINFDSQKVLLKAGFKKEEPIMENDKIVCSFIYKRADWHLPD